MVSSHIRARERLVTIGTKNLEGILSLPAQPSGLVIFAHGSGSSRHSPRNTQVAIRLQEAGLATLLFDLLSEAEASDRAQVFNIPLLAERLEEALDWALMR
jgi:putative phosphoribosyl transferase